MESLLSQRDALMAEIAILSTHARVPCSAVGKTRSLLTRYWSKADWQSREEILRAARWLLNLGKMHSFGGLAKVSRRKPRPGTPPRDERRTSPSHGSRERSLVPHRR